ncbi:S66 peptidase family protein [Laceyella putida]|uniref:LD-carboxypeptidase n=1 Tax=Laceyella putida TaxID=110101 RepID=A0ABW2RNV9_9BACL
MKKPPALKPGDTIGVIAPASPMPEQERERALQMFRQFGYRMKVGPSVYEDKGYLSGTDEVRARDVNDMFADPEVRAIICMRGGYGSPRILDRIDFALIRHHPKIFVGYSDITALHLAIQKQAGLVTFHGPMVGELARVTEEEEYAWSMLFRHLTDPTPLGFYPDAEEMFRYPLTPGTATGTLIGGNLCLLVFSLGTPYELDTTGKILFVEEIGEEPYRIDRMLTQLRLAGKLERAEGIVFTDFHDCEPANPDRSLTLREVLEGVIQPLGIPAYFGFKAGHTKPNLTLPQGIRVRMNANQGTLELLEGSVV